jgi:hypothetical protein
MNGEPVSPYTQTMRMLIAALAALIACSVHVDAQQRRRPAPRTTSKPKPKPTAAPPKSEPAQVKCPESLGSGVRTGALYCFVLAGRDPVQGVIVTIPPHSGDAKVSFDLHNRHTYSEEEAKAGRGFAKYTAVIGVLTLKGDLLERGAVQTEVRAATDLHERIAGGAGPGGVKAVAPVGSERVQVTIPAGVDQVSLLGETLDATTAAGREVTAPGRPVALVSNIVVEYRPRR